jgi:hypothetical protein
MRGHVAAQTGASPEEVARAINTFRSVGADPGKLELFCDYHRATKNRPKSKNRDVQQRWAEHEHGLAAKVGTDFVFADGLPEGGFDPGPLEKEYDTAYAELARKCR